MSKTREICLFHGSDTILAGAFTNSGSVAATGGKGRVVALWDTDGGEKIMSMPAHMADVTAVEFKGDNSIIGSGDTNGLLKIWDLREARLQRSLDGHRLKINSIAFHPYDNASICATGSQEGRTKLWDIRRKGFFRTFGKKGSAPIYKCEFSPDGEFCAIGDEDGLKIWKITDETSPVFSSTLRNCKNLAFHHREMLLAATTFSDNLAKVHFFDLETMAEENTVKIGVSPIDSIIFHSSKPILMVVSKGKMEIVGWDPNDVFDHVVAEWDHSLNSAECGGDLLVMTGSDRSSGKIIAVDLSRVQLTRLETPATASRKTFEDSRPGTMEAFLGNENEIRQVEDELAIIEIANADRFKALISGCDTPSKNINSDLKKLKAVKIEKSDFNKVISNERVDYMSARQRSMEHVKQNVPSHPFTPPYKSPARAPPASISQSLALQENRAARPKQATNLKSYSNQSSPFTNTTLENLIEDSIDFNSILNNRREALESVSQFWPDFDAVTNTVFGINNEGAIVDILKLINRNVTIWSLSMCATILDPNQATSVGKMVLSHNPSTLDAILDTLKLIMKYFERTIIENLEPATSSNVDLQGEQRRERAFLCYQSLCQSKSFLQSRANDSSCSSQCIKIRQLLIDMSHF